MLDTLRRGHHGITRMYYLDVPFEDTMRRHATRPQAAEFGREQMSSCYRELDLLPGGTEQIIPASRSRIACWGKSATMTDKATSDLRWKAKSSTALTSPRGWTRTSTALATWQV